MKGAYKWLFYIYIFRKMFIMLLMEKFWIENAVDHKNNLDLKCSLLHSCTKLKYTRINTVTQNCTFCTMQL